MDGSAFKSASSDTGTSRAAGTDDLFETAPIDVTAPAKIQDDHRHWLSVLAAAVAHVAIIAALLPAPSDAMGENGVSLEAVAVSIVDSIPRHSTPETASDSNSKQPDAETDEATTQSQPEATEAQPVQQPDKPQPQKQALALDLPPDAVPPPLDAPALPARKPDAERDPRAVHVEEPVQPREDQREKASTTPAAHNEPAAPARLPSQSAAEASSGVVRAYAGSISRVLDRQKPRSRGLTGQVRIQFVIDQAGRAEPPVVLATSGNAALDSLVITAVQRMDFPPPPPEMNQRQRTFNVPFSFR